MKNAVSVLCLSLMVLACSERSSDSQNPVVNDAATESVSLKKDRIITNGRIVTCSTVTQIQNALKNAQAGDRIIVKSGSYRGSTSSSGHSSAYFYSSKNGTAANPITIQSENPSSPAILKGQNTSTGYVLYLTGDYWQVLDIKINTGKNGVMLDNSNGSFFQNVEVYYVGQEAVHVRDGSSNNYFDDCLVYNTGLYIEDYGEGFYIGSDYTKWNSYTKECDNNIINSCDIWNTTAESVDIKEGTTGTEVKWCNFHGDGMTGANGGDSFIDAKGNDAKIHDNKGYRENDADVIDAFQVHVKSTGWGYNNDFYNNTLYLDNSTPYVVRVYSGSARASNNTRNPSGNMYAGNVTQY